MGRRSPRLQRGELETLVLDLLWDHDGWLTPGDVADLLADEHPVAYTTAMTILVRLWNKGMVERRQDGRAFAYHPTVTRDEWAAKQMSEFLDNAGDRNAALTHFVSSLSSRQLTQLRRAVDRRQGR
jgi:predicted transcriptional regulator